MKNELPQGTANIEDWDDLDREAWKALACLSAVALALVLVGVGIGYLIWG